MFITGIINLLATVQALLFAIILLEKKAIGSKLLAAISFCFSLAIMGSVLAALNYYKSVPHLIRIGDPCMLAIPPLIFLYTKAICGKTLTVRDGFHFLPFLIYVVILIPFYQLPGQEKIQMVETVFASSSLPPMVLLIAVFRLIISTTYIFLSLQTVRQYHTRLKENYSSVELDIWMVALNLLIAFVALQIALFVLLVGGILNFLEVNIWGGLILSVMFYVVLIFGWKKKKVLLVETENHEMVPPGPPQDEPARRNEIINAGELEKLKQQLKFYMEQEKPYTNPELSLPVLAAEMKLGTHQLSYIINQGFGQNFFDFVNSFRVQEVIGLMKQPQNKAYTIISLAFEAGFNSKSTFNTAFKKYTGKTPSEYKRTENQ